MRRYRYVNEITLRMKKEKVNIIGKYKRNYGKCVAYSLVFVHIRTSGSIPGLLEDITVDTIKGTLVQYVSALF